MVRWPWLAKRDRCFQLAHEVFNLVYSFTGFLIATIHGPNQVGIKKHLRRALLNGHYTIRHFSQPVGRNDHLFAQSAHSLEIHQDRPVFSLPLLLVRKYMIFVKGVLDFNFSSI